MMLVPAGFLILMLFAAIAVDSSAAYLGQRQLTDALAAAANDAATAGLDDGSYYSKGTLTLDPVASAVAVCASLAAQGDSSLHHLAVEMGVSGPVIKLRGTADIDAVFGRLIPHFGTRQVGADVSADARQTNEPSRRSPPVLTPLQC